MKNTLMEPTLVKSASFCNRENVSPSPRTGKRVMYSSLPTVVIQPPPPPKDVTGSKTMVIPHKQPVSKREEKKVKLSPMLELKFTASVLVFFVITIVVPLSMIIIGGIYVTSCSAEVMIPVFLIVCGGAFLASMLGVQRIYKMERVLTSEESKVIAWGAFFFQIGWFIAGCVWVYRTYEPDYTSESSPNYCNETLYKYSFWLLNSLLITLGIASLYFVVFVFCTVRESQNEEPKPTEV